MKRAVQRAFAYADIALAVVGAALSAIPFAPGFLSPDPIQQLMQARAMKFDDWHPPVMSFLWAIIDRVWAGPAPMLFLQLLALWGCFVLVFRRAGFSPWARAVLVVLAGLAPHVIMLVGTVWKDVHMGLAFLATAVLIVEARARGSRAILYASLATLWYGTAVRHNALAATVPMAVLWLLVRSELVGRPLRARTIAGLAVALSLVVYGTGILANKALTGFAPSKHLGQQLFWFDLAGISVRVGQDLMPPQVHARSKQLNLEKLKGMYKPASINDLVFRDVKFLMEDEAELADLRNTWVRAIGDHPGAYLAHRRDVVMEAYGIGVEKLYYSFADGITHNPIGIRLRDVKTTETFMVQAKKLKNSVFFRPWVHLALCAAACIVAHRRRVPHKDAVYATCASGVLYALAYVVVGVSADFRYVWWTALAAIVAWALAAAPRPSDAPP